MSDDEQDLLTSQGSPTGGDVNVLVLGMHRSGTSAVAGLLTAAGLYAGQDDELVGRLEENPGGFFERPDVVDLDNRLLAAFGWAWDTPDPMPLDDVASLEDLVREGRAIVRERLAPGGRWVLKDPRMSLLLPWWRRILLDRFVAVVPLRDPAETAWSLSVRDGFSMELGLSLWGAYHRHLAVGLEGLPVVTVDYGALTEHPELVAPRLLDELTGLGVDGPLDVDAAVAAIRPALRRPTQPSVDGGVPTESIAALRAAWWSEPIGVHKRFQQRPARPNGWESAILLAHREQRNRAVAVAGARDQLKKLGQARDAAEAALAEARDAAEAALAEARDAAEAALAEARNLASTLTRELESAATAQVERESLAAQLQDARHEALTVSAERDALTARLEAARNELEAVRQLHTEVDEERTGLHTRLGGIADDLAIVRSQLSEVTNDVASLVSKPSAPGRGAGMPSIRAVARRTRLRALRALVRFMPQTALARVWHNPLFDSAWYYARYQDVSNKGIHAEQHFRRHGVKEGRRPNDLFGPAWYLSRYPDVARSQMNPLDHYLLFGAEEGRDPGPGFSSSWYLEANPDVRVSGMNPLLHYIRYGQAEGRLARSDESVPQPGIAGSEHGRPSADRLRLLLVVHDAHNHGAQQNALHMARTLASHFGAALEIVMLGDGSLWPEFEKVGRVHDFAARYLNASQRAELLRSLHDEGTRSALCNTTASGQLVGVLKQTGYHVVTLIHELPELIQRHGLREMAEHAAKHSDALVFASDVVRHAFEAVAGAVGTRAHIRPQGLYRVPQPIADPGQLRREVRVELGLPDDAQMVLGVGFADERKGFDLFVDVCGKVSAARPDVAFVWLGCESPALLHHAKAEGRRLGFEENLRLLPRVPDVERYYATADIHLLPSREDPYPSVVLEAMSYGLPTVAFAGATGIGELLERGSGLLVPKLNTDAMAQAAIDLLTDDDRRREMGLIGRDVIAADYDWLDYLHDLLDLLAHPVTSVSVVVPNYNYARHLQERLSTIFAQTHPIREVIVLDDASTDDSLGVLERLRAQHGWSFRVVTSTANSGSVFRQWLRGVSEAQGDLIWIAEADDYSEPTFVERLAGAYNSPQTLIAYCQSRQVDDDGRVLAADYLDYVRDIDHVKWTTSWIRPAFDELAESFAIRNPIPNVSAVLFRRQHLERVLNEHLDEIAGLKVAGDYAVYVRLLSAGGHVAFVADSLNDHRRHSESVTTAAYGETIVLEIAAVQRVVHTVVPVAPRVRVAATEYLKALCEQFELSAEFRSSLLANTSPDCRHEELAPFSVTS